MLRHSQIDYQSQLAALLPQGPAWRRSPDALLTMLIAALAEEPARLDGEVASDLQEGFPDTTAARLFDWERALALPECNDVAQGFALRKTLMLLKLTESVATTPERIVEVAARMGYTVTVQERFDEVYTCESPCEDPIYEDDVRFVFYVFTDEVSIIAEFTCETPCEEPLRMWGNELLECVINRLVPAHAKVLFAYGG